MKLDHAMLEHIASLSKLKIYPEQRDEIIASMQKMIDFAQTLDGVELKDVAPTTQIFEARNITREDVMAHSMPREDLLKNAPDVNGEYIKVPTVIQGSK